MPAMFTQLGQTPVVLVAVGGIAYVNGALCYARKRKPYWLVWLPRDFHLCVIAGASCHYAGAWLIMSRTRCPPVRFRQSNQAYAEA